MRCHSFTFWATQTQHIRVDQRQLCKETLTRQLYEGKRESKNTKESTVSFALSLYMFVYFLLSSSKGSHTLKCMLFFQSVLGSILH